MQGKTLVFKFVSAGPNGPEDGGYIVKIHYGLKVEGFLRGPIPILGFRSLADVSQM